MKEKLLLFNVLGQKRPSQGVHQMFTRPSQVTFQPQRVKKPIY